MSVRTLFEEEMMDVKRCPFCRNELVAFHKLYVRDGYFGRVVCLNCHATGNEGERGAVVKQWNEVSDAVESWGVFYEVQS